MPVTFKVNGASVTVDAPPDMPLLWVLRDLLDLKGTKFGCGVSECGACTVHLNGRPTRSCQVRVENLSMVSIRPSPHQLTPSGIMRSENSATRWW